MTHKPSLPRQILPSEEGVILSNLRKTAPRRQETMDKKTETCGVTVPASTSFPVCETREGGRNPVKEG